MGSNDYDVVISGYGPTGLAAASLLSRRGHRVCVFERWPTLYGMPRVASIDGECARVIQAASDVDIALRNTMPNPRYILANESGQILQEHDWRGHDVTGFPYRSNLYLPDIEDAIDIRAREQGADIRQGWEVVGFDNIDSGIAVEARERIAGTGESFTWGKTKTVTASYVIGADGARSTVRELLEVQRDSWPTRGAWLTIDMVRKHELPNLFGISPDGRANVIFCVPEGRAHSVIPLGKKVLRINFEVDPDGDHRAELTHDVAYRRIEEVYGLTRDDIEIFRVTSYAFEGKLARQWKVGRVFLAGDAAHVMTPFLGQGGCSALRDAVNLSWKLDLVLRGLAPDTLLETYQAEREPHVRDHIDGSDRLAAMAFMKSPEAAAARDREFLSAPNRTPPPRPKLTTGVLQHGEAAAAQGIVGGLGPQGVIRRGTRMARFDDVFGWGFQLIGWRDDPARYLRPEDTDLLRRLGAAVVGIAPRETDSMWGDVDGDYAKYFEQHGVSAVLVRPDFIVFGVARTADELPALVQEFAAQLGIERRTVVS